MLSNGYKGNELRLWDGKKIICEYSLKKNVLRQLLFLEIVSVVVVARTGHVPTFLKSFRSVLERGPSAKTFRSRSIFFKSFRSRSVPFHSVLSRKMVSLFRSVLDVPYLKNGSIPLVPFLVKECFHPPRPLRVQNDS